MAAARPRPPAASGESTASSPPPAAAAGEPPALDAEGAAEAARLEARILDELRREGVAATAPGTVVGARAILIRIALPRGSVARLDTAAASVQHRLATEGLEVTYRKEHARREFELLRSQPRAVELKALLERKRAWLSARPGRLVLGERPDGEVVVADLADAATPHLLVAGNSGSGKSWLLKAMVASLIHFHGPEALRVRLLDPKRVTFNAARFHAAIAAHLDGPLLYGVEDALPCFERYVEIMEERYQAFEAARVADLDEWNAEHPERRLARYVVVMDEFADLVADRRAADHFSSVVARLGAKARAAGVHLVLATQRPDRQTVPPIIKANLGGRIALRVSSAVNSRIVLDQAGAELLHGSGDLLADLGRGIVRCQGASLGS